MRTSGTPTLRRPGQRASRRLAAALVLSLAAGGCAGGPGARVWAARVCTVLSPWRVEIGTLTSRTQQQMTAATTPAQAKENLSRLFGGAQGASEVARAGVQRAGVPAVADGKLIASSFTASLAAMRDAYGRARVGIDALETAPPESFYTKVTAVVQTLNTEYARSELDTSRLASAELKQAFAEAPECS